MGNAFVQIQENIQSRNERPEPEDKVAGAVFVQVTHIKYWKVEHQIHNMFYDACIYEDTVTDTFMLDEKPR